MALAIELKDVTYQTNEEVVLEAMSFQIHEGEYVGIIGPNGGGKTTLLRLLLGLQQPTHGQIRLFTTPLAQFRDWPKIGYLSQRAAQVDLRFPISVEEVVQQGRYGRLGLFHQPSQDDQQKVEAAMKMADVSRLRHRLIEHLSGGERQRTLLARALAGDPAILVLDEPLTGVDVTAQQKFYEFLQTLNQELGLTIVFVSHDIEVLAGQATKLIGINHRLVFEGKPDDVFDQAVLEDLFGADKLHRHHAQHGH